MFSLFITSNGNIHLFNMIRMDGNQFVLLTCLLGQIENYNTMIIPPNYGGNITDVWNSKVWACPESVIDASENKKGQVLRIHCVIHTSRGLYNRTNPSVTIRTVTRSNQSDKGKCRFFSELHIEWIPALKKIIFKEVFDIGKNSLWNTEI